MGKILTGIVLFGIIFGVLFALLVVTVKADNKRIDAWETCEDQFNSEDMPFEGREGYLMACMNN